MTPELKEKLTIELINGRRRRWGFKATLKPGDITPENSVSYLWAKDVIEDLEKIVTIEEKNV